MTSCMARASAALLVALCLTACSHSDSSRDTADPERPCDLVDAALASEVLTTTQFATTQFSTTGDGAVPREARKVMGASCIISGPEMSGPKIQVRIGEVASPGQWRDRITEEAKTLTYGNVLASYDGEPGYGYGVTYSTGIYANGAGVNVVKGDRVIRVTVYHWVDSTAEDRLSAAEKIANNADANLTAYDVAR